MALLPCKQLLHLVHSCSSLVFWEALIPVSLHARLFSLDPSGIIGNLHDQTTIRVTGSSFL